MVLDADCLAIRDDLDAFVDNELPGTARLRVSQHLERCSACAEEVQSMGVLGDLLRDGGSSSGLTARRMDGLASGVVTRSRAEWAESWRGLVDRAGWHWALVGLGSVASTFVLTLFVWMILAFGPVPQRADSLSAIMVNFSQPAGQLFIYATPSGENREAVLLELTRREAVPYPRTAHLPPEVRPGGPRTTAELVGDLSAAVARQGHALALDRLTRRDREHAQALLSEISRRLVPDTRPVGPAVRVNEFRLFTSASVTARGL
jgi:hypothetical protein